MRRLYRLLLKVYPVHFREEYGTELELQFADEYRDAESRRQRAVVILRALGDVAATAPAEIARELLHDLRFAIRIYRQRSVATALALLALALAIGTTTGIFSVLNALMIRSLPFREPDRLVEVSSTFHTWKDPEGHKRGLNHYLEEQATYAAQPMNLAVGNTSFRVTVAETTANFLHLLGTEPESGRGFLPGEDGLDKSPVAVIGHGLWEQAFGGDPRVLGSTIRINGEPVTVVGVAPPQFDFPVKTAVWTQTANRHLPSLYYSPKLIARLRPGISDRQASAMYAAGVEPAPPQQATDRVPRLVPLRDYLAGPVRSASLVLLLMMVFVLLIACANLAHLLLSRMSERRQELAIRVALGASRARLTRQLITEATVLTVAGAIAGLAVAQWTARLAEAAQPAALASRPYAVLDWRVLAFALGIAALTGILFGVVPASLMGRMQPGHELVHTQPGIRGSGTRRVRGLLIAGQAALTVMLAAGAFGMGRTFLQMMGVDLGYRTSRVVTLSVSFPDVPKDRTTPYCVEVLERLRSLPGVESAAAAAYLPLVNATIYEGTFFQLDGTGQKLSTRVMAVSPDYFRTMGTPMLEGREFMETEKGRGSQVVIVNEQFARKFPNQKLVGRRVYLEPASVWATIVGVVRSHRFQGPEAEPWDVMYRPIYQYEQWRATFVAKVRGKPEPYLGAARGVVQDVDRSVPVFDVKTLDQRLADTVARPRFYTTAIVFLTGFALLVAAIGAYGAANHGVSQRRHEIGVRIAVGGPPARVRGMVFRQSMMPVLAGIVVGLAGSVGLGRFLRYLMTGAQASGVGIPVMAALAIGAATAYAVWIGTSRVVRTDPTAALRVE